MMTKKKARREILRAANKRSWTWKPYTMRHIQQAVCVVRRAGSVKSEVLEAAGFNPRI